MDQLFALSVAVPLVVAAALVGVKPLLSDRRRTLDAVAVLTSASVTIMLLVIMVRTYGGDRVYWFAGFRPFRGIAIGIDFEAGPLSGGLAALVALLVTASMVFSWRYFQRVATFYHALMLTFLAGMAGFCLTGGHLRPVCLVRADGRLGLRADRVPAGGAGADPGRAQLRHHQQRGRVHLTVRYRLDLWAYRRATDRDPDLDVLVRVLAGELPWCQHVHRADDIGTAIRLADEFGYRLVINHGTEGLTTDHNAVPINLLALQAILTVREGLDPDTPERIDPVLSPLRRTAPKPPAWTRRAPLRCGSS